MAGRKRKISFAKILLIAAAVCAAAAVLNIGFYLFYPDVSRLKKNNPARTSFMEYREQEWKKAGRKIRIQQAWRPFSAISPYVVKAVIIAEDDKFWHHDGFDFAAMHKAMDRNIQKGRFKYGGSTISQQLAKNLYLTPARNPVRKLKEAVITWRIENTLSKRRILELYLNVAEWGEGTFGIEAASRRYFGKSASDLGPAEAARLVAVLPNPRRYNPVGTSRYVEARSEKIYDIMVRRGIVIENLEEVLREQPDETPAASEAAPHGEPPPASPDPVPGENAPAAREIRPE